MCRYTITIKNDNIVTHYADGYVLEWQRNNKAIRLTKNGDLIGDRDLSNSTFNRTNYFSLIEVVFNMIKDGKFDGNIPA